MFYRDELIKAFLWLIFGGIGIAILFYFMVVASYCGSGSYIWN